MNSDLKILEFASVTITYMNYQRKLRANNRLSSLGDLVEEKKLVIYMGTGGYIRQAQAQDLCTAVSLQRFEAFQSFPNRNTLASGVRSIPMWNVNAELGLSSLGSNDTCAGLDCVRVRLRR